MCDKVLEHLRRERRPFSADDLQLLFPEEEKLLDKLLRAASENKICHAVYAVECGDLHLFWYDTLAIARKSVKDEEQRLEEQLQAVDAEIESLGDTSRDESAVRQCTTLCSSQAQSLSYIESLHKYNEMKDLGQDLLGRLAMMENCTVKELYAKYGLDLDD